MVFYLITTYNRYAILCRRRGVGRAPIKWSDALMYLMDGHGTGPVSMMMMMIYIKKPKISFYLTWKWLSFFALLDHNCQPSTGKCSSNIHSRRVVLFPYTRMNIPEQLYILLLFAGIYFYYDYFHVFCYF